MQLTQLEHLIAVEKYGSISKAARESYTSQSSISSSIKALETELGVEVFRRGAKGVQWTEEGQYILEKAKQICQGITDIKMVQTEISGDIKGRVALGGTGYCCVKLLGNAIIEQKAKYPNIQYSIINVNQNELIRMITDGSIDIGFIQLNTFNESYVRNKIEMLQLNYEEVFSSRLVVAVSKEHPLYDRKKVATEELLPYEIVTGMTRAEELVSYALFCELQKLGYDKPITCLGDFGVSRRYALRNNCIQLVPLISLEVTNYLYSTHLYPIELESRYDLKYLVVYGKQVQTLTKECVLYEFLDYLESVTHTEIDGDV